MAGGMSRRRGLPLSERARVTRGVGQWAAGRHCYVDEPPERPGRFPALLVEWRQDTRGWSGLVAYLLPDVEGRMVLVQRWLPASHLSARDRV